MVQSPLVANARMYSVAPAAEVAWRELLAHVAADAGVAMDYVAWPAPQPLEPLWARADLGAVMMCGFPLMLGMADVEPLAAAIPSAVWAQGRAAYRSDFIVRAGSKFETLEDTFGHRLGWTVGHSHSGFNAPRHHLLQYRTPARPRLYTEVKGDLVTARKIVDGVIDGTIDVGPLDGYWHMLLKLHFPEVAKQVRTVASTDCAPMPPFVAARGMADDLRARLGAAFVGARDRPWFAGISGPLALAGFAPARRADYALTLQWDEEAKVAGYLEPG